MRSFIRRALARIANGLTGWLCSPPRGGVTLLLMAVGLGILGFAGLVGVASTASLPGCVAACPDLSGIERGYLFAPNWSLTGVLVWPLMYFALSGYLSQIARVFTSMDDGPMSWLKQGEGSLLRTWRQQLRWLAVLLVLALLCALIGSWAEWWNNSGAILLRHRGWAHAELDWSIAMRGRGTLAEWGAAAVSFLAFTYQSLVIVMLFVFAGTSVLAARAIGLHASGDRAPPLLIDLGSNDPNNRGGFEGFVLAIDYMIMFVFCAYVNFFATRLQNALLRDPDRHSGLLDFIQRDIAFDPTRESLSGLFAPREWDFSSAAVAIGSIQVLFFSFFFFNASLRHAAVQARNRSDHALMNPRVKSKLDRYSLDVEKSRERLSKINVWPLGYSDILPTLALLVISMTTIIFYRLGIVLIFGWVIGWVLTRATAGLVKRS